MDSRTRKGYARLLWDLQLLELSEQRKISLKRAKVLIDELERLIMRIETLGEDLNNAQSQYDDRIF